jgi:4-amino-4-deoxy-L-arabinose transferase-like glycosyltransferase
LSWAAVGAIAAAKVVFQLATSTLYGFHRDEFYYLASGRHLAWGYVDQPPLVPAIDRVAANVFGASPAGLHVFPALLGGVYVLLAAVLVVELGGGRRAQVLASLVAALGPLYLTTSHFLSTVSLDIVFWAVASLLVLRLVRTRDTRLWVAVGAVVGIGLLNKYTMAFWVLGAVGGLLLTPERRLLASRHLLLGAALALVLVAPNLVWQMQHHWASLEFDRRLRVDNGRTDLAQFLPLQLGMVTLAGTVVWVAGLRAIGTRASWKSLRWLAIGYVVCFVVLFALSGKAYYLGSWYLPLVAAGAVAVERYWSRRAAGVLTGAVVVTGLLSAPLFTPVLPERVAVAAGFDNANKDLGGMLGWHRVVNQLAAVVRALPPDERRNAVILTADYSEAGAINLWGPAAGLPHAFSGHNTYWWWGHPGGEGATVIAVRLSPRFLSDFWQHVEPVAVLGSTGGPIDPQERGAQVSVCTGQRVPWSVIWPKLRHYG